MKLSRLLFNAWTVLLLANLWLCQQAWAADTPPGKQGAEAVLNQKVQALVQSQLREQTAALETRQAELEKRVLEAERKSIDWWFAWLAIFTTLVGVGGALIPYLLGRKDKELLKLEIEGAKQGREEVERQLQNARDVVASINDNKSKSDEMVSALRDYTSGPTQTSAQTTAVSREAKSVVNDPNASKADKLYARAVLVSEEAEANLAQATYASELWQALTVLDPQDGNAAFNYAYWLQQKFVKTNQATPHDWRLVSDAYAKAGRLEVGTAKNDSIPNYWGNALANEAEALKEQDDLAGARVVWNQAGDKYAQALAIKADAHDAASNWGLVLLLEAQAIKDSAPDEAEALLAKARGLLERHRDMREAGAKKVAYNLACVYALQNQAGLAVAQLEVCRLSGQLVAGASHWRTDPDLGPIRQSPEYLAWKQQHFPNE